MSPHTSTKVGGESGGVGSADVSPPQGSDRKRGVGWGCWWGGHTMSYVIPELICNVTHARRIVITQTEGEKDEAERSVLFDESLWTEVHTRTVNPTCTPVDVIIHINNVCECMMKLI